MLAQLKAASRGHTDGVVPLLSTAEELPLRTASLDLVTAFNCVHHFDLARFLAAVARVLRPGGQLFVYTRTPQQNARTIWGRYFPGFTEHEQRLHSEAAIRDAVSRTDGLTMVAAQTFQHPRTSTAERLGAQAQGRHYSTFSFYTPEELRAAIATFLTRLPSPEVSWVDEHLLVIVGGSHRNQAEPDGPASLANQAIKDQALQISAGRAGQAPQRHPGGRAQITPLCAQSIAGDDLRHSAQIDASLCQVIWAAFFLVREVAFWGRDRRVGAGPGVAWPKSWRSGCEPAALATESFPACPPGPWAVHAASAFRCL
jgi:hypothetical protein